MQRKPDRFERRVTKIVKKNNGGVTVFTPGAVVTLLRQEHDWMMRMVKDEMCVDSILNSQKVIGWNQALNCILDKLTQRRK